MSNTEIEESLRRLLEWGILEQPHPQIYRLTKSYWAKFRENLRNIGEAKTSDPYGETIARTLAEMVWPDGFTVVDLRVVATVQRIELGLERLD